MAIWAADRGVDILEIYNAHAISLPLEFVTDPSTSSMWSDMGENAYNFENEAMALNSHTYSINPDSFITDESFGSFYRLTSISYEPGNTPADARPFTATMEAKDYPFFGT